MPKALILGSAGQDGVYLTRLLHTKGYTVDGIDIRPPCGEVDHAYPLDLRERLAIREIVARSRPDEVYFLAAFQQSSEGTGIPEERLFDASLEINTFALKAVLDALTAVCPAARFLYASSSRVFGEPQSRRQTEDTPLRPIDPYGISKALAMEICGYWRRAKGFFATAAILYNHESPLRLPTFLSRKIVRAAVTANGGVFRELRLGNLSAQADWGHAADTVHAMWLILQHPTPEDYVVATGKLHSVRDWLEEAFGIFSLDWRSIVVEDPALLNTARPAGVLCGDSSRLCSATGWRPSFTFREMVRDMVTCELSRTIE
jgi:GDPmannose 4,6-dehydratase